MEPEEVLEELDLTEAERKVYMNLLKIDKGTASKLAKEAGIQRRLAYDITDSLAEKGLINYVDRENKRVYKPCNPENLRQIVEDRRSNLKELEEKLDDAMPDLKAFYDEENGNREVKVLEGKEGIKQLFNDELRQDSTIYLIGSATESEDMLKYFLPSWTRKRQEKDVKIKGVFEHEMKGMVGEHEPIEHRYLPEGYNSKVSIAIYGSKVGIVFWIVNPLVIMIEDEQAAASFKNYWELVWDSAEK